MSDKKRVKTQKFGFLTQTQRDYIESKIAVKTPRKVMNYRIRQAFKKAIKDFYADYAYIRKWNEFDRRGEKEVDERMMQHFKALRSYLKPWNLWSEKKTDRIIIPMNCSNCGSQWDEKFYKDKEDGPYRSDGSLPPSSKLTKMSCCVPLKWFCLWEKSVKRP